MSSVLRKCVAASLSAALPARLARGAALAACALIVGCGDAPPAPTEQPLVVTIRSDGLTLSGAIVRIGSELRGTAGADGVVRTTASGLAGTAVLVTVECPAGNHLERPVVPFVLGPSREQMPAPRRIDVECVRDSAQAVVIVRASGRTAESVRIDGREVGQLDAEGLAHVLVAMAPRTRFQVSLGDVATESAQRATFTMPAREDVFFFDAPPRAVVRTHQPQHHPSHPTRPIVHLMPRALTSARRR